jgi:hypothetical protein
MFKKFFCASAIAAAGFLVAVPAQASDQIYPGGGTLAQLVDGGGTYSIITLVNLESVSIPYILNLYNDAGQSLTLTTSAGTNSIFTGVIPPGGSTIIRTLNSGSAVLQGYATVTSESNSCPTYGECNIAGSVVFGIPLPGLPVAEASVPLDSGFDSVIAIPFDSTTANVGLAIANSLGDAPYQGTPNGTATVKFAFYDQSGNNFYSTSMPLASGQHTAFILATQFPQIAGQTGIMIMQATDASGNYFAIKTLGLRVNLAGTTYTTITPIVPCNGGVDNAGYYVCGN